MTDRWDDLELLLEEAACWLRDQGGLGRGEKDPSLHSGVLERIRSQPVSYDWPDHPLDALVAAELETYLRRRSMTDLPGLAFDLDNVEALWPAMGPTESNPGGPPPPDATRETVVAAVRDQFLKKPKRPRALLKDWHEVPRGKRAAKLRGRFRFLLSQAISELAEEGDPMSRGLYKLLKRELKHFAQEHLSCELRSMPKNDMELVLPDGPLDGRAARIDDPAAHHEALAEALDRAEGLNKLRERAEVVLAWMELEPEERALTRRPATTTSVCTREVRESLPSVLEEYGGPVRLNALTKATRRRLSERHGARRDRHVDMTAVEAESLEGPGENEGGSCWV